jgi:hypothetical protein
LSIGFTDVGKEVLAGNSGNLLVGQAKLRFGSVYGMSPQSPFIKSLAAIPIAPNVHAHSIIAVSTNGPLSDANDGVVEYLASTLQ